MTRDTIAVTITRAFDAAPERVFDAWLDPAKIRAWMGMALEDSGLPGDLRRVELDARVGGCFTFSDMRPEGEAVHWGTYLEIDRPRKLVFTWFTSKEDEKDNRSTVTLTIMPDGKRCVLTLVHEMDAKWVEYEERTAAGWTRMLAMQARLLGA